MANPIPSKSNGDARSIVLVSMLGFLVAACATAPGTPGEKVAALKTNEAGEYIFEEKGPRDEVICKRQRISGSHVPQNVCKTRGEIDDEREAALQVIGPLAPNAGDELQRRPR